MGPAGTQAPGSAASPSPPGGFPRAPRGQGPACPPRTPSRPVPKVSRSALPRVAQHQLKTPRLHPRFSNLAPWVLQPCPQGSPRTHLHDFSPCPIHPSRTLEMGSLPLPSPTRDHSSSLTPKCPRPGLSPQSPQSCLPYGSPKAGRGWWDRTRATPSHRGDAGDRDRDPQWGGLPELSPSRASAEAAGPRARARTASRGRDSGAMLRLVEGLEEERWG